MAAYPQLGFTRKKVYGLVALRRFVQRLADATDVLLGRVNVMSITSDDSNSGTTTEGTLEEVLIDFQTRIAALEAAA